MGKVFATRDSEDYVIERRATITAHPSRRAAEAYLSDALRPGQKVVAIEAGTFFGDGWIITQFEPGEADLNLAPFGLSECTVEKIEGLPRPRWRITPRATVLVAVVRPAGLADGS